MSIYLLDTDTVTLVQRANSVVLAAIVRHLAAGDRVGLTVVTVEEQALGWFARFRSARDHATLAGASRMFAEAIALWGQYTAYPLTESALAVFERLKSSVSNVGRNDLRIAAIALDLAATVVTRNRRDFGRVPGLAVVDWSM